MLPRYPDLNDPAQLIENPMGHASFSPLTSALIPIGFFDGGFHANPYATRSIPKTDLFDQADDFDLLRVQGLDDQILPGNLNVSSGKADFDVLHGILDDAPVVFQHHFFPADNRKFGFI
jgi:hypothetical protein